MNNSRFFNIVIILLLLLNTVTLAFLCTHKAAISSPPIPPLQQETGNDDNAPYRFLVNVLNLDSNQQQQYSKLRDEHHEAIEKIQEQNRDLHKKLYDLLSESKDSAQAEQLANAIANNQKQIELITFHHFLKVRALCNPQQQNKFDSVINDALRMMAPPPPPPPHDKRPRDGRPGPPPPPPDNVNPPPASPPGNGNPPPPPGK